MTAQMPYDEINWWENQLTDAERTELMGNYQWHGEMEERHAKLHEMYLKWQSLHKDGMQNEQ